MTGLISFPGTDEMTDHLVTLISMQLGLALQERSRALFAVSGGSSPKPLYEKLSHVDMDWSRIDVILVDERWVNPDEEGSNASFINNCLLQNHAAAAHFVGLKTDDPSPYDAVDGVTSTIKSLVDRIDVAVLGMGPDGHTASWFPHAKNLADTIDPNNDNIIAATTAHPSDVTGQFLERITLTLSFVRKARLPVLMISGAAKQAAFNEAQAVDVNDMPVKALLTHCPHLWPCWAP